MRVYVSSTSEDLEKYRGVVIGALQRSGHTPVCMEHHAASDVIPKDECLREVATCDAYVGLFAWRYGSIPPGCDKSFTEMEYREAVDVGIPALVFLLDEKTDWPDEYRDEGSNGELIARLRRELQENKWAGFFNNPDNLASEVLAAISLVAIKLFEDELRKAQAASPSDIKLQEAELQNLRDNQADLEKKRNRKQRERVPTPVPEKLIEHFQDRETELSRLYQCLEDESLKMVLVSGRGGMGKTTLLVKLLRELQALPDNESPVDGIVYLSLGDAGSRSPDRIVEFLSRTLAVSDAAAVMDIWDQEGISSRERLAELFRGPLSQKRYLVALDNLESVLDDENQIREEYAALQQFIEAFIEIDHASTLMITSRRALMLSHHVEVRAMGRRIQIPLDEGLPETNAVSLLRGLDSEGRLGICEAPDDVLRNIAIECQCIPRTLESLVATLLQKSTWTLATLLENKPTLIKLIENPARELFSNLSSEQEKLVVQVLAVFNKPVPGAAIHSILPALPIDEILDKFVSNFICYHDRGHFWLHPLDQLYAYRQIPDQGKPALHKHAAVFYEKLCIPKERWKTIEDVEPQLEQFQHLVQAGLYDDACRVLNEIDREHLSTWGYSQQIMKMRSDLVGHIRDRGLMGLNLGHLGSAHLDSGEPSKAIQFYKQALMIAGETGNNTCKSRWMGNLGLAYSHLGDRDKAVGFLTQALEIAKDIDDRLHINRWLGNLAGVSMRLGKIGLQEAVEKKLQALMIANEIEDWRFVMFWASGVGNIYQDSGDLGKAKEYFLMALETSRRIGARSQTCSILLQLGDLHGDMRQTDKQEEYYQQAIQILGGLDSPADNANVLIRLAAIHGNRGDRQKQRECYEKALMLTQELGERETEYSLLLTLGDLWVRDNDRQKAMEFYQRAAFNARRDADTNNEIISLIRMADNFVSSRMINEAAKCYERALDVARESGSRSEEAIVLSSYANMFHNEGKTEQAITYYNLALPIIREMEDMASQTHILNRLGMAAYFLGDIPGAVGYYQQSLEIARKLQDRGGQSIALFNIGDAYHLADDVEKAIPYYMDALLLDVHITRYKCALNLGIAHLQMGQQQAAKSHFENCLKILEESPADELSFHPQLTALGISLLALGRTEEGLDVYRRGLELSPHHEDLHYAIQDLNLLKRIPQDVKGTTEALKMIMNSIQNTE